MSALRVEFRHLQFLFAITLTISLLLTQNALGQASYTAQVRGYGNRPDRRRGGKCHGDDHQRRNKCVHQRHTDDHGLYLLTGLRPSTYTIRVEAAGFRSAESKNVVLAVDQQATLNFSLKPGRLQDHGGRDHSASPARYRQRRPRNGRQQ